MINNRIEKVIISLHAHKLKNVAGAFHGTSDPYAVVTLLASDPTHQPTVLGKTEVTKNDLSPHWVKTFELDYEFAKSSRVNVGIYDEIRNAKNDKPMGSAVFEIGEIVGSPGNIKAKKLKDGGILYCRVEKAPEVHAGTFHFQLRGVKLKNVDSLLSKTTNPFFELSKCIKPEGGGPSWQTKIAYRSEVIKKDQNPKWKAVSIGLNEVCDGNKDQSLLITVKDWDKKGKHITLGSFETTVNSLMHAKVHGDTEDPKSIDPSDAFQLIKKRKAAGLITVICAVIEGGGALGETAPSALAKPSPSAEEPEIYAPAVLFAVPVHTPSQPKFVDYLSGGLELQLSVAIDFTGSNGDPRKLGTLHYIDRTSGQLNNYEKALTAVGSIVGRYDSDQQFPMLGFGAKFGGIINHCFQLGPTPEVSGIKGMLDAYRNTFATGLTMSGPTVFAEVIELAATQARHKQDAASRIGQQAYQILLILTDGAVTDIQSTKRAIMAASSAPLSIVIVGIGNADFSAMQFLDDFMNEQGGRDICQFVEFQLYEANKIHLSQATLEEIPDQVVGYFQSHNIMPLPALTGSKLNIVSEEYDQAEDLDLSLHFGEEGEINLASGGRVDDTGYGTYNTFAGLTPMAPPPPRDPSYNSSTSQLSYPPMAQSFNVSAPQLSTPMAPPPSRAPSYNASTSQLPYPPMAQSFNSSAPQPSFQPQPYAQPYGQSYPSPQVVSATVVTTPVFHVQLPPGVNAGQQLQIQHPQTQQQMIVTVPAGVAQGGTFPVAY